MKLLPLLLVLVGVSLCEAGNILEDDDVGLERHVRMMNKPPVKTFTTEEGRIIDCVDINKQPSLEHPLLKNHKVQREPALHLTSSVRSFSRMKFIKFGLREPCPIGSVPISRVTKEDLIRAKASPRVPSLAASRPDAFYANQHMVYLREESEDDMKYGTFVRASSYNLSVAHDQFSAHTIWIQNGPRDQVSMITLGWMVNPQLYGDSLSRFFSYWTGNGHRDGCYNLLCPGFVLVDRKLPLDIPLPGSTYGGRQFELPIQVEQDRATGNWWLMFGSPPNKVGYWPKELFLHLGEGAQYVAWGGVGNAGSNGVCPPMGSGHKPDGDYTHATYFRELQWINKFGVHFRPEETSTWVDKSNVYDLQYYRDSLGKSFGYWLSYGGPGGNCGG